MTVRTAPATTPNSRYPKSGACVADPGENKRLVALPWVTNSADRQRQ
ncbi:hypothetical protein [Streptomyces europaeiscabiei]|nr:hypothetical protein [Streptomyces europaeiscabiei]MDX3585011.1 hypothetical protein [Streptomyces europaeiscabiei]